MQIKNYGRVSAIHKLLNRPGLRDVDECPEQRVCRQRLPVGRADLFRIFDLAFVQIASPGQDMSAMTQHLWSWLSGWKK